MKINIYDILNIIKEFEGIIGAILGSIGTLIATDILKRKGKLNIYLMDFKGKYWYREKDHYDLTTTKTKDNVLNSYKFEFIIDVYNSNELPKIMRDIKICIYKNKTLLNEVDVNDEETRRISCHCVMVDKTTVFNINGRQSYNIKLSAELPEEETHKLKDGLILKLKYKNEKGKNKYFEIFNGMVEEPQVKEE